MANAQLAVSGKDISTYSRNRYVSLLKVTKMNVTRVRRPFSLIVGLMLTASPGSAAVMLGAHVGRDRDPNSQSDFEQLEKAIGRKLAIDNHLETWADMPDRQRVAWDFRNRRLPMLSWRVALRRGIAAAGCATANAIAAGTYDRQIEQQAHAVKALGAPVLIRFNYEMTTNPENTCFTGFDVRENLRLAGSKYIAAWQHVVQRFRAAGATNARWVWAPGRPTYEQGIWRLFYPGDRYVDWIGIDDYNKRDVQIPFPTTMEAFYAATSAMGKPLMIAETGAVNNPNEKPDPQTLWLITARTYLKSHPAIKAFIYWNNPGKLAHMEPGYGGSGYILVGPGLAAFKAMADDPYFQ